MLKSILAAALLIVFCSLHSETWEPLATVPSATGYHEASYLGELVSLDGTERPENQTRIWLWTQNGTLRLHVEVDEPLIDEIAAAVKRDDDSVWKDDSIDFYLYPKDDRHFYHFIYNCLGTRYDENEESMNWNGRWTVQARRRKDGWDSDVSVDLEEFGGVPADGTEWHFQIGHVRILARSSNLGLQKVYSWAPSKTNLFKEGRGIIRFANVVHPTAPVSGDDFSETPQFIWSVGTAPSCRLSGTLDTGDKYAVQRYEYTVDGQLVMRANWTIRKCLVKSILVDCINDLEHSECVEKVPLLKEARMLLSIGKDGRDELCSILEEEAYRLRSRIRYVLSRRLMSMKGKSTDTIAYGIQSSLVRMRPIDDFTGAIGESIVMDCARNEMEAAQVTLFAGEAPLIQVQARTAMELKNNKGAILPGTAVRIRRIGHVMLCAPVYKSTYIGPTPDPLLPDTPFDIPAYSRETLWVDVIVPAGTAPGTYRGAIAVKARNSDDTIIPLEVHVRPFTIPRTSSIVSAFGCWFWDDLPYKNDKWAFYEDMLEHRVTPYEIARQPKMIRKPYLELSSTDKIVVDVIVPGSGQLSACLASEDGMAGTTVRPLQKGANHIVLDNLKGLFGSNRLYQADFTVTGTAGGTLTAALKRQGGATVELVPKSLHSASTRKNSIESWADWQFTAMDPPCVPAVVDWSEFDEDMERAFKLGITSHRANFNHPIALWARIYRKHLAEKGWLNYFYTYLSDEPTPDYYPVINQLLAPVKMIPEGDLLNMMTARSFPESLGFVDTWCPEGYSYNPELAPLEQAKNRNVWWYVAFGNRPPHANVWMDSPLTETRSWLWQTWKHNVDGILYWSVNWWPWRDPWRTGETFKVSNGDGNFMYPDESGKPISSVRWEVLRDGLEDYELFCMLEAAKEELGERNPALSARITELLKVNPEVCVSWKEFSRDHAVILAERRRLMDCLEKAVDVLGHEPVITRRPVRRSGRSKEEIRKNYDIFIASEEKRNGAIAAEFQNKLDAMTPPAPKPETGLELWYSFDAEQALVCDLSGHSRHTGCFRTFPAKGRNSNAVSMSSWGHLVLPSGTELLGETPENGTIAFWFKAVPDDGTDTAANRFHCLFSMMKTPVSNRLEDQEGIILGLQGNRIVCRLGGKGAPPLDIPEIQNPLLANAWTHIAVTWEKGRCALYLNGNAIKLSVDTIEAFHLDGHPACLGYLYGIPGNTTCEGDYDELRIYSRALSPDEILNLTK